MKARFTSGLLAVIGVLGIAFAVFADQAGLDANTGWGTGRRVILAAGLLAMAAAVSVFVRPAIHDRVASRVASLRRPGGTTVLLGASGVIVIAAYVWFVSVGYWTRWPESSRRYEMLATAFQHGQLALLEQPDPRLLDLPNPYDCTQRGSIPVLWDASLYQGNYYLYFGPVPAVILVVARVLIAQPIPDQYLVFAFLLGLFAFSSLLLGSIWRRFFSRTPTWTLVLAVLVGGLVFPTTWLLSSPEVYEAAIAGSQFFFIGGIYFAYTAMQSRNSSYWRWLLTGVSWSLAIGCRPTIMVSVLFVAGLMLWTVLRSPPKTTQASSTRLKLAALALPLLVGTLALGGYNQVRFGSAWEVGLRYQLTRMELHKYGDVLYGMDYVGQNARVYLLRPFSTIQRFPFVKPQLAANPTCMEQSSSVAHTEGGTGLLFAAPYLLLAVIPGVGLFSAPSRNGVKKEAPETSSDKRLLAWLCISLLGAVVISFSALLLFFYSTMRYLEEVVPALVILASIGLWQGYAFVHRKLRSRLLYSVVVVGLAAYSIIVGTLLSVTGPAGRFTELNHGLLQRIYELFGH